MSYLNYQKFFNANGLTLLGSIFEHCDNTDKILTFISRETDIAIKEDLTDDEIASLKEFELKNYEYLTQFLINNLNTKTNTHRMRLDWFILGFAFLYLPAITFIPLSETGYRVADTILGVVIGVLIGSVLGFWYDGVAHKKGD